MARGIKKCLGCGNVYRIDSSRNSTKTVSSCSKCTMKFSDREAERMIGENLRGREITEIVIDEWYEDGDYHHKLVSFKEVGDD